MHTSSGDDGLDASSSAHVNHLERSKSTNELVPYMWAITLGSLHNDRENDLPHTAPIVGLL
jgi:hypothetical protein